MQLMGEGDKWQLYLPSELAYGELDQTLMVPCAHALTFIWYISGDRNRGQYIKAGDVLVFELEILKVKGDIEKGTAKPN